MRPDPAIVETFLRYARRLAARGYVHNTLGNIVMRGPHPDYPHGVAHQTTGCWSAASRRL